MSTELDRLLIVDDEREFAKFIAIVARGAGYAVKTVDRSPDFEAELAAWKPTVVFLDVFMPDRDGLELLGTLQHQAYGGHVVMMSGADPLYLNMAAASAKARGLRLSAVLPKPCRKLEIAELLKTLSAAP